MPIRSFGSSFGGRRFYSYKRTNPENPYGDTIDKHRGNAVIAGLILLVLIGGAIAAVALH